MFDIDINLFYRIRTSNGGILEGFVVSKDSETITVINEVDNISTFNYKDLDEKEFTSLANSKVKVPQIIKINIQGIVDIQRVYQKDEYKKYYFIRNISQLYIPSAIYLSDEQKKYELGRMFDTIEDCQKECDLLNSMKGWSKEKMTHAEISEESKEAMEAAIKEMEEEEKENGKQD